MKSDADTAAKREAMCFFRMTGAGRLIRIHRCWPDEDPLKPLERCSCNKFKLSSDVMSKVEWLDPPGEDEVKHETCYINAQVGGWVHVPPPKTLVPPWECQCVCGKKGLTNDVPFRVEFIQDLKPSPQRAEAEGAGLQKWLEAEREESRSTALAVRECCVAKSSDAVEAESFFNGL